MAGKAMTVEEVNACMAESSEIFGEVKIDIIFTQKGGANAT